MTARVRWTAVAVAAVTLLVGFSSNDGLWGPGSAEAAANVLWDDWTGSPAVPGGAAFGNEGVYARSAPQLEAAVTGMRAELSRARRAEMQSALRMTRTARLRTPERMYQGRHARERERNARGDRNGEPRGGFGRQGPEGDGTHECAGCHRPRNNGRRRSG